MTKGLLRPSRTLWVHLCVHILGAGGCQGPLRAGDGAADGQTEIPASRSSQSGVRIGGKDRRLEAFPDVDGLLHTEGSRSRCPVR